MNKLSASTPKALGLILGSLLTACGVDPFASAPAAGNPDGTCVPPQEAQPEDSSRPDRLVGDGTPESCTQDALVAALRAGRIIAFNCGPNRTTIYTTATIDISLSANQELIIDGGGTIAISGSGVHRIFNVDACQGRTTSKKGICTDARLVMQNLTLMEGNAGGEDSLCGGALYVYGGLLKIVNCKFFRNQCNESRSQNGGALQVIQNAASEVHISNTTFGGADRFGNQARRGGAISGIGPLFGIYNSLFTNNAAIGNSYSAEGGAVSLNNVGSARLCGDAFINNSSNGSGGAISFSGASGNSRLTIENTSIMSNANMFENTEYSGIWITEGILDARP